MVIQIETKVFGTHACKWTENESFEQVRLTKIDFVRAHSPVDHQKLQGGAEDEEQRQESIQAESLLSRYFLKNAYDILLSELGQLLEHIKKQIVQKKERE